MSREGLRYRFAADLRHRKWSWVALAAIIGVSAGVVLALVAGARRARDSATHRFLDGTDSHDTVVISGVPGQFDFAEVDMNRVVALPDVAEGVKPQIVAAAGRTEDGRGVDSGELNFIADPTGRVGRSITRFKYLDGRPADPEDPREVVVAFRGAEELGLEVGSTIDVNFLDQQEIQRLFEAEGREPATFEELVGDGPLERLRVVGVVVTPGEMSAPAADDTASLWMTPAAARSFGDFFVVRAAMVRLEEGRDGEPRFLEELGTLGGGEPVLSLSVAEDADAADRSITPTVRALLLAAALLGVVTLVVAGQALARQAASESVDDPTLRALGWTGHDLLRLRVAKAMAITGAASIIALAVSVALSPLFPLGLARIVEPDPGMAVDPLIAIAGPVGVFVVVSAMAIAIGWWDLRSGRVAHARPPSRLVAAIGRSGAPPSVVAGTSFAVQSGPAARTAPMRAAVATIALGITTVIAVLCFSASLSHLNDTPQLYGWNWDIRLGQEFAPELDADAVDHLRTDPAVRALAVGNVVDVQVDERRASAIAVDDRVGRIEPALIDGRKAREADEIVVSPDVGSVGDQVRVSAAGESARFEIVGHAALPLAEVMMTFGALRTIAPETNRQVALVGLREGADRRAFIQRTLEELALTEQDVGTPRLPPDLVNFGRVDSAPAVVGGAMALVAIATLVHALVVTVRRRRRELAVLRTLGFVRSQAAASVTWQALLLSSTALVIAVPLGILIGRVSWRLFATELQVVVSPVLPVLAVLGTALGALLLTALVGIVAGSWSSRRSTAVILRAE